MALIRQAKALRQEVKILSTLDHPNIIKYLGTEFKEGALRIFLELATDGTVKDALNEFGPTEARVVLQVVMID